MGLFGVERCERNADTITFVVGSSTSIHILYFLLLLSLKSYYVHGMFLQCLGFLALRIREYCVVVY